MLLPMQASMTVGGVQMPCHTIATWSTEEGRPMHSCAFWIAEGVFAEAIEPPSGRPGGVARLRTVPTGMKNFLDKTSNPPFVTGVATPQTPRSMARELRPQALHAGQVAGPSCRDVKGENRQVRVGLSFWPVGCDAPVLQFAWLTYWLAKNHPAAARTAGQEFEQQLFTADRRRPVRESRQTAFEEPRAAKSKCCDDGSRPWHERGG